MASDMDDRACDDDELLVCRCDGCGGVLEPRDAEPHVIYACFHVLHADCADWLDACPRCQTPRPLDDDDQPEPPVDEAQAPASPPPDNDPDEDLALVASDGMGNDDDRPGGGGGESPASMSGSGCNACCCSRRVAEELERRFQEKSAALTETTSFLESELERARSRLCRLEEMYGKLEEELIRLRDGDGNAMERKKPRNGGEERFKFPTGQD